VQGIAPEMGSFATGRAHDFDFDHDILDLARTDPGVHRDPSTDRARDARAKLEATETLLRAQPHDAGVRYAGFGAQAAAGTFLEQAQLVGHEHDTFDSTVEHQDVEAVAEYRVGNRVAATDLQQHADLAGAAR